MTRFGSTVGQQRQKNSLRPLREHQPEDGESVIGPKARSSVCNHHPVITGRKLCAQLFTMWDSGSTAPMWHT